MKKKNIGKKKGNYFRIKLMYKSYIQNPEMHPIDLSNGS